MKRTSCYLLLFLATLWSSSLLAQQPEERSISQAEKKIVIDGILDEWTSAQELAVDVTPDGKKLAPSADLAVSTWFTFDAENFYVAVKAMDDRPEFPEGGRRPGFSERGPRPGFSERGQQSEFAERGGRSADGFLLTLADPSNGNESERFLTFYFSKRGNMPVKALVNRNGEPFLQASIGDVQLKIVADSGQKSIVYEAAIPWKYVPFFRPFLQPNLGINLSYIDFDAGQKKVVQLFSDPDYDSPFSNKRKASAFRFVPRLPERPEFQALLSVNHFYEDQEKKISLGINSPSAFQDWQVRFVLTSSEGNVASKQSLSFEKGMNILSFPIETKNQPSGLYDLSLGVLDDKGAFRYSDNTQFFLLNKKEFESFGSKLADIQKGDLFQKDAIFRESLATLEIRLQWIKQMTDDPAPLVDLDSLHQWNDEMKELFRNVDEGKPALFPPGMPARLAYRSESDHSLKAYSVLIPANYDPKKSCPLLVTLSTGGADDRVALAGVNLPYSPPRKKETGFDLIVLSPQARALSDWYVGDSAKEVIECIGHLKKLYTVDEKRIAVDGFGIGGYGAWRIGLLHPQIFKAVIVRSGRIAPADPVKGDNILDLLSQRTDQNFLIIQGDKDEMAPVEDVRKGVARMQELKMNVEYVEVKGEGYGDYNKWPDILNWLKNALAK